METALRYELIESVKELNNAVYPTNAPETYTKPYLVYTRITTPKTKTFEGYTGLQALSYLFSIMATKYSEMVRLRGEVENMLLGMPRTQIGKSKQFYVQDLDINNIDEQYEHELKVNRGIIDFTIYFKE